MSAAVATASQSIETLICSSFDSYQKSTADEDFQANKANQQRASLLLGHTDSNSTTSHANQVRKQIADYYIASGKNVALDEDECVEEVQDALAQIVRATLANVVTFHESSLTTYNSFKSSDLYEATNQVLDMVASLVCEKGNGRLAIEMVNLFESFSNVDVECVRAIVCQFMSLALFYLFSYSGRGRPTNIPTCTLSFLYGDFDDAEEFAWREEVTGVIKDVLTQRLQDKSQAVRLLSIQAAGRLFRNESEKDYLGLSNPELHEDITQELLWNLSHDPSFANRSAVIQCLPVTIDTLPAIVSRTRDSKLKVRVDALDVLCNKVDVKTLTRHQRLEILQSGLSARYPATYHAATKMLCCGWMKSVNFDPIKLLELLEATSREETGENQEIYEDVCVKAARAIIAAASEDFQCVPSNQSATSVEDGNVDSPETRTAQVGITTTEMTLAELSPPEVRAYKESVLNWNRFKLGTICKNEASKHVHDENISSGISPALILYIRTLCDMIMESTTLSDGKKSTLLSDIVPDVTVLGEAIESHMKKLDEIGMELDVLDEAEEADKLKKYEEEEEMEVFICLNLLKMANVIDLKEEGTKRHFSSIIYRILCNPSTHADLIEGAVLALSASHDNEAAFLLAISQVVSSIIEEETHDKESATAESCTFTNPDIKREKYLRGIEILSVTFEKLSRNVSSNTIFKNFSSTILSAITDISLGSLVREAGVSCLGRFLILMDESTVVNTYKPILMEIAYGEEEKVEIRAQAMLALCDLAFIFDRIMTPIRLENVSDEDVSLHTLLVEMMSQAKKSLAVVAAECAAKLHFTGKMHDAHIIAQLVVMYFDKSLIDSETLRDGSVKEVGSPTRLVQLLTVFFPAYSMGSEIGRETLKSCFKPLVEIVYEKTNLKIKGKKKVTWPIAKMVEYICDTVETGEDAVEENSDEMSLKRESPLLAATIAICYFIKEEVDGMTTAFLRSLCKILSKSYIDVESEDSKSLKLLKRRLDDLAILVTDDTSISYIEVLIELMDDIQFDKECDSSPKTPDEPDENIEQENDQNVSKDDSSLCENEMVDNESTPREKEVEAPEQETEDNATTKKASASDDERVDDDEVESEADEDKMDDEPIGNDMKDWNDENNIGVENEEELAPEEHIMEDKQMSKDATLDDSHKMNEDEYDEDRDPVSEECNIEDEPISNDGTSTESIDPKENEEFEKGDEQISNDATCSESIHVSGNNDEEVDTGSTEFETRDEPMSSDETRSEGIDVNEKEGGESSTVAPESEREADPKTKETSDAVFENDKHGEDVGGSILEQNKENDVITNVSRPSEKSRRSSARSRTSKGDDVPAFAFLGANANEEKTTTSRISRGSKSSIPLFASIGSDDVTNSRNKSRRRGTGSVSDKR